MLRRAARTLAQSFYPLTETYVAFAACQRLNVPSRQQDPAQCGTGAFAAAVAGAAGCVAFSAIAASADSHKGSRERPVLLYQYEVCPWCNKVKAVLDYHNVPYRVVEVNPVTKKQLAFSEYKKVPVLITQEGEQVNDSAEIIKRVVAGVKESQPAARRGLFGRGEVAKHNDEAEQKWVKWADTTLVQIVTTNIYSTVREAFQTSEYVNRTEAFGTFDRAVAYLSGGLIMYYVGVFKLPKKYGLEGVDLRQRLYDTVNEFVDAVGDQDFLGGKRPDLADLAVFGIIRAVQNTDTFYDMLEHSRIKQWWFRMVETVGESSRVEELED